MTTKAIRLRFKKPNVRIDELEIFGVVEPGKNLAHQNTGAKASVSPSDIGKQQFPIDLINDGQYGSQSWRSALKNSSPKQVVIQVDFADAVEINQMRLSNNRENFYDTDYLTNKSTASGYQFDLDVLAEDGSWQTWTGTRAAKQLQQQAKQHPGRAKILHELNRLIKALADQGPRPSFVGRFLSPPPPTHVLLRGSPENPRDEVVPAGPAIFAGDLNLTSQAPGPTRRAKFADWITQPQHPLTARVMVNRIWHHVFGAGIVATTSDFGTAGAPPTHPELLDWLAAEFVDPTDPDVRPWSIKSMISLMVRSHAFQQSGLPNPAGMRHDAGTSLLWRFPPKRVEAEVIRDSILQASGSLDRTIGGRGYRIHNVKHTYAQWQVVDNHGPTTWRRMLYQERMRRVDDQIFTAFDFPDCGQVRAKRPVSTTPLQALNLLNSDFVMDQAARIAARATSESQTELRGSVERCFELLLCRRPDPDELAASMQLAQTHDLKLVARALINSNEFAFLP